MQTERKVSLKLVTFATVVADLIELDGLDSVRLLDSVNSALGELVHDDTKTDAKVRVKVGKNDKPDTVRFTEKVLSTFKGNASNPLRLYQFSQDLAELEKVVGKITLSEWPSYLAGWVSKFKLTPSTSPVEPPVTPTTPK